MRIHRRAFYSLALAVFSTTTPAMAAHDAWPTSIDAGDGFRLGVKGLIQYDANVFTGDALPGQTHAFEDAHTWRRKQFYLFLSKKGRLDIRAGYDFQSRQWMDNYVAILTSLGRFRIGQFKTPVGWEDGNTSSGATTFVERSLPEQAVYEGRREGLEWFYSKRAPWLFQLAGYTRHDLNDDAAGNGYAGRIVFSPWITAEDRLHLGLSASRELRDDRTGRVRARPEVALTPVRLVDTSTLPGVDRIDRRGLELAWRRGPWLLQSEYLNLDAVRPRRDSDYHSSGYYLSGSWVMTGETRPYRDGAFSGIAPRSAWGALELALRYATLDLNDGEVRGGREHDWTLGLNWYLSGHLKLQANYIRAFSDRGDLHVDPHIYAVRAQIAF